MYRIMGTRPMTIRYLDPPLHEFLPTQKADIEELAQEMGMTFDELQDVVVSLHEFNPMMGHRGCRLCVTYPEIAEMQTNAVIKAALKVSAETGTMITPYIMIPLVGERKELKFIKDIVVRTADALIKDAGVDMKYHVGTMIEIPRAALTADEIAKEADFFSFGTNDLTQMTFGFSRDDAAKFLGAYYDTKIYENDPFQHLDVNGVGKLVEMACKLAARRIRTSSSASAASTAATRRPSRSATRSAWTTCPVRRSACPSPASPPHRLRFARTVTRRFARTNHSPASNGRIPKLGMRPFHIAKTTR